MDRINQYLDIVPLPFLLAAMLIAGITVALIPSRLKLPAAIALVPIWLSVARFQDLGAPQALAKATSIAPFLLVIAAAWIDPFPKRRVPPIVWIYPVIAILSTLYVLTALDVAIALVIRLQWFLLCIAGIMVVRTIADEWALVRVFKALAAGCAVAVLLMFGAIVKNPGSVFAGGLGRWEPWGANQNHVGPLFIMAVPLLTYFALRTPNLLWKSICFGIASLGLMMALLTASRSAVFPVVALLGVLGWEFRKKPVAIAGAVVFGLLGLAVAGKYLADANLDRLQNLETERYEIVREYLGQIAESPIVGIMGQSNVNTTSDEDVGAHAHNAYLDALRLYGVSLCIPLFGMIPITLYNAYKAWQRRKSYISDPMLITLLTCYMFGIYFHGLTTIMIYYSTYTWAMFHVVMSTLFITLGSSQGHELALEPVDEYDDEYGYEDEYEGGYDDGDYAAAYGEDDSASPGYAN